MLSLERAEAGVVSTELPAVKTLFFLFPPAFCSVTADEPWGGGQLEVPRWVKEGCRTGDTSLPAAQRAAGHAAPCSFPLPCPKILLGTLQAASPHYLKGLQEEKAAGLSGVGRQCPPGCASVCTRCACASARCSPGTELCELTAGGGTRGAGLAGMEQKAPEPAQLLPAREGGKGAETLTCLSSQTWKRHGAKYRHPAAQA